MTGRVALALATSLLVGLVIKLPGLVALDDYAQRAYEGLWYSDVVNLYNRDFWAGFVLPYRDVPFEYPVLAGLLHAAGGISGSAANAFFLHYAVLAGCAVVTTIALGKVPGARPILFALSPALLFYAGMNWDLLAIAPLALGCVAFTRGRDALAGALIGVGIAAKLFPLAFLPALAAARWGAGRRTDAAVVVGSAALVVVALNLPVVLAAPDGWWHFYRFSAERRAHSSIFNASPDLAAEANPIGALIVFAGWAAAAVAVLRRPERWLAGGVAMLFWWLLWNKVTSPQFSLYLVFGLAALDAPIILAITLGLVDLAYFVTSFQSLAIWGRQQWDAGAAYSRFFVQPVVWTRIALLGVLSGWAGWRLSVRNLAEREGAWRITSSSGLASPAGPPPAGSTPTRRSTTG